jgi:hydroxymethylpyrimidine pyrophosphatase-like HAD family hydrolase
VLEERIAQVDHSSRTPLTFLNIPNFCLQYLYQLSFSREELETLIDIQEYFKQIFFNDLKIKKKFSRILSSQKCELVHMEIASLNPIERELLQIIKQHVHSIFFFLNLHILIQNNLKGVLNSLKTTNWQERNEFEKQESERLHTAIAAMRTAIENKRGFVFTLKCIEFHFFNSN